MLFCGFAPAVFEAYCLVENQLAFALRVGVDVEVAQALELEVVERTGGGQAGLDAGRGDDRERVGIEVFLKVVALGFVAARLGVVEEAVVDAHFGGDGVACRPSGASP